MNSPNKVVIYGDSDFAEQVKNQLDLDDRYKVVAFTVDESKFQKDIYNGLPVIKFQLLKYFYNKNEIKIFPAIGYSKLNSIRELVYKEIINQDFEIFTYISKNAIIGKNVNIGKGVYITEFVSIGTNVKIGNGVIFLPNSSIAHDVIIEDFVFCSHSVTIGGKAIVKHNSFIGLSTTIKDTIIIAENNIVGAACNVIKSTEPNSVYIGNPAVKIKNCI